MSTKVWPCFHVSSLLLLVAVSSASIYFCRNRISLYLRNHLIQRPNFTQKEGQEMLRDSQAKVLFSQCCWNVCFIYSRHSLRKKITSDRSARTPKIWCLSLPPTSPFVSPFQVSHTVGSSECSSHDCSHLCIETPLVLDEQVHFLYWNRCYSGREGPSRETLFHRSSCDLAMPGVFPIKFSGHIHFFSPAVLKSEYF